MLLARRPSLLHAFASLAGLCLALALAGCSDAAGPVDPAIGSTESAEITPYTFTNDKTAYQYFVSKGLTSFQSAGIVGNLDQESGMSPTAVQSGGPGRGIAQWSVGGRWDSGSDNLTAYANAHGQSVWALGLQLDFIWYELTTYSGYGLTKLKASTNVTDATIIFQTDFEGCGTCVQSQRIAYAKAVLAAYGATPDYAAEYVSQSFPTAATTMKMTGGQAVPSYIELKNVGAKAWDSNTRLAPTQPRDRKSAFANGSWVSPTRAAEVKGTVPPGGTYKFAFDLAAPNKTATYDEFFGVVQEGVAWFSDASEGGPVDNQLEVKISVTASATPPPADGGAPEVDGGEVGPQGGGSSGTAEADGGVGDPGNGGASSSSGGSNGVASTDDGTTTTSGCSVGMSRGQAPAWPFALGLFVAAGARVRARRRQKS